MTIIPADIIAPLLARRHTKIDTERGGTLPKRATIDNTTSLAK
ncbi:MAG: hypothetical protein ONB44_22100 [candidate division KSB1 bacterium]|nr:hypothetical protein [candidate division KSB1 bacterium]MDZ7304830.1 hypothetical protein [candidate division KSB1 bacterium]MDZ7313910.1 hypothetical protein [candidate division KSB1 bacterium]